MVAEGAGTEATEPNFLLKKAFFGVKNNYLWHLFYFDL